VQDFESIYLESVPLLQALIQCDTRNPPGQEALAIDVLTSYLNEVGIRCQTFESVFGRPNLIATYNPSGQGAPLYLVSHVDVVPADPAEWKHPPLSGAIVDGRLWGRGTLDTKQLTAMEAVALKALARSGIDPGRPVVLFATADEEKGSAEGMGWLAEHHPGLFRPGCAINEGGGFLLTHGSQRFYLVATGQRGSGKLTVSATSAGGHVAAPPQTTALMAMVQALTALGAPRPLRLDPVSTAFYQNLADAHGLQVQIPQLAPQDLEQVVEQIASSVDDPLMANIIRTGGRDLYTPTTLNTHNQPHQVPASCSATVSIQLMPSTTETEVRSHVEAVLDGLPVTWEFEKLEPGHPVILDAPLVSAMADAVAQHDPGARLLPFLTLGGTDARFMIPRGIQSYGFSPTPSDQFSQVVQMVHNRDESIALDSLVRGTAILHQTVLNYLAKAGDR